jgi:membrane associated rhomboid family serine protease
VYSETKQIMVFELWSMTPVRPDKERYWPNITCSLAHFEVPHAWILKCTMLFMGYVMAQLLVVNK